MSNAQTNQQVPFIPATTKLPEITVKAIIIAIVITIILAASNTYLALKLGSTISGSIPAAVAAMAILRFFKRANILENNIIQTAASAGEGVAAAAAFVLPALIILKFWDQFYYWDTFLLTSLGGACGILFSIPLRRVLLNYPNLRFPEGTAIGNVLIAGASKTTNVRPLVYGSLSGGLISFLQTGFQVVADNVRYWFTAGNVLYGYSFGFSPAMIAAGYIVGFDVALTLLSGSIVCWFIGIPIITAMQGLPPATDAYAMANYIWDHYLRFIGIGTMVVGGLWTLLTLLKPIAQGIHQSIRSMRAFSHDSTTQLPRTERDIPINIVGLGIVLLMIIFFLVFQFNLNLAHPVLTSGLRSIIGITSIIFILIFGFIIASICGYFAGLIGSTNNPLSGLLISSVLIFALIVLVLFGPALNLHLATNKQLAIYIVIIVTTMIATTASIANENLQDLKAGRMVGSTPWKQQIILLLGVATSAFIIAPIFELLFQAYGIGGIFPHPNMNPAQMLAAPQAGLMATIATGVFAHNLPWGKMAIGGIIAVFCIVIDELLKKRGHRLPVLAVGLGIYLPPTIITPIVFGGLMNYLAKRRIKIKIAKQKVIEPHYNGTMLACGLVAGAALMSVILAIPFALKGSSNALRIAPENFTLIAIALGIAITIGLCYWLYHTAAKLHD